MVGMEDRILGGGVGAAMAGPPAAGGRCFWRCCFDHSSNILRICSIWAGVNSASCAQTVVCGIIMRTASAPVINKNRRIGRPPCSWGLLPVLMTTKGALAALTCYVLMCSVFGGFVGLLDGITHGLLCAWRQGDFAFLQTVVRNGDNPFAAFALDFQNIATKFCDELTTLTSRFGRLELFAQPPGVSVKIH